MPAWVRRHPFLTAFATLVVVVVVALWAMYQAWLAPGPWQALPDADAPTYSDVFDPAFVPAAETAIAALSAHRREQGFPGITAAVAHNGKLLWRGGAGWQNLAPLTPVSPDTQMRIGSTSKAVTATAAARLIDRAELGLDAPISTYLNPLPNPAWGAFTLRQLFSHTAGLPGYEENTDYEGLYLTLCGCRHYQTVYDSLEIFDGSDLLFEAGTDFHYSSFDTNLIGAVMASQQDTSFAEVLQRRVLKPLGLSATGLDNDGTSRPHLAVFYAIRPGEAGRWADFDLSQRWPGGGLVSTSTELALIGGAWLDSEFISTATREAMWTPQVLANGEVNEQRYALGWRFYADRESNGRVLSYAHHGGVSKGAMSWLVVYPGFGLSIAVNINTHGTTFGDFARVEPVLREAFISALTSTPTRTAGMTP